MFQLCDQVTKNSRVSDIEPYWHLSVGTAKIERVVPMMPMSREVKRLQEALKVLSLYRLAFGQPRQEELLRNLMHRNLTEDELAHLREKLVINLAPHMRRKRECYIEKNTLSEAALGTINRDDEPSEFAVSLFPDSTL